MQGPQIAQLYPHLFRPRALLYALKTALGLSPQVNMAVEYGQLVELVQILVESEVEFEFHVVHFALFGQQLRKNLFVGDYASLRKQVLVF
jgi:hypothetical protein